MINTIDKNHLLKEGFVFQISKNRYILGIGPFQKLKKPSKAHWSLFYSSFFYTRKFCWLKPAKTYCLTRSRLLEVLGSGFDPPFQNLRWTRPNCLDFKKFFLKSKKQIQKKQIQKIVPVLFESTNWRLKPGGIVSLIKRLVQFSEGSAYAWWQKSGALAVLGNTPEPLFYKKKNIVRTTALAGTSTSSALLRSDKNKEEQELVVKDIKLTLKDLGALRVGKTVVFSIGKLKHLRTDITLKLKKNISFKNLCRRLHPTAALGGFPRRPALSLLKEFHKINKRGYYGAPLGLAKGEEALCLTALRNIQFIKGRAFLGSGAGIVKASQLKLEWAELKLKRQVIKDILFKGLN